MVRRSVSIAIVLLCLGSAAAAAADAPRFVSVEGVGEVTARPDVAEVTAGVVTRGETAREALERNNALMPKVLAALSGMGIADGDIRTRGFGVEPVYGPRTPGGGAPQISGYQVSNRVEATLRAFDKLGAMLDRVVSAGANTIHNIRFRIGEQGPLLDAARRKAVEDARHRATVYAEALGVRIGAVQRIEERAVAMPHPRMLAPAEMQALRAVPIARGEQMIRATLGVTFAIE